MSCLSGCLVSSTFKRMSCLSGCLVSSTFKRMSCLSEGLVSSTSVQKLFCGSCSTFKRSFEEFVGEKLVSPTCFYTILTNYGRKWTKEPLDKKVKGDSEKVGLKLNIQKTKIMTSSSITSWQIDRETMETVRDFIFLGSKIAADGDCSHEIKRRLLLGRKAMTNLDSILKSREITLATNVHVVKAMVFPVVMYGCESWTVKKAEYQRIDSFELWYWTLESPLGCREIQPVNPKGSQFWVFIGRTDTEAETPVVWSPDVKNRFIWKDPVAGKDWRQEEKGMTEDEMVRWHHRHNGHEFE